MVQNHAAKTPASLEVMWRLTDVSGLLRILVMGQVVARNEDGDGKSILQRQADLIQIVQSPWAEQRRVDGVMRRHGAHE